MRFVCQNCQAKYSIADEKIKNRVAKLSCQKCKAQIVVRGPRQEEEHAVSSVPSSPFMESHEQQQPTKIASLSEIERIRLEAAYDRQVSTKAPESRSTSAAWFAIVDGQQLGPYPVEEVKEKLASGQLTDQSYVWRDGMKDWIRIAQVAEIQQVADIASVNEKPAFEKIEAAPLPAAATTSVEATLPVIDPVPKEQSVFILQSESQSAPSRSIFWPIMIGLVVLLAGVFYLYSTGILKL